jgi:S-adenosylmethionine-diacylglycerol 3-amino-3-carboxypropyl transferase
MQDTSRSEVSAWVEEVAKVPLAFAQVREDALVDLSMVERLGNDVRVMIVASGGCTVAALAASGRISHLHVVDPNPAQIVLARLKLRLLETTEREERLALLGHAAMDSDKRRERLVSFFRDLHVPMEALGPIGRVAEFGPDHYGRYELLFAELRRVLSGRREELLQVLQLRNPAEQARRVDSNTPLGHALDAAFDEVMTLTNLVQLFGESATQNRVEPFARHFARRTRHVLATLPAADNPYLSQLLVGRFPTDEVYPWLAAPIPQRLPPITWKQGLMTEALEEASEDFNFIHLSNILDWLTAEEAAHTLDLTWRALRKGGWVVIRQLNSTIDIPSLDKRFDWRRDVSQPLHQRDRSFFYRGLYLGVKP